MKFSLLLASRQRLGLLTNMLNSISRHTKETNLVEVLIAIDSDDPTYNVKELESHYASINLRFFIRERSEWMHKDYINWIYTMSSGKYVIVLNDDTIFAKSSWDLHGWNALEKYLADKPDGIVYGFTETGSGSDTLCTFPLFSRKAVDALGWVLPNERKNWGADHDVYAIYNHPSVNRCLHLREISIHHISIHTGKRARDEISYSIEKSFMTQHNIYIPISHYIEKLSKHIKSCSLNKASWQGISVSCILISKGNPDKAFDSVLSQTFHDWELIIINGINYKKDSRTTCLNLSGNTGWCINECFRNGLIHGHLVVCLTDEDMFYENAFSAFVNFFRDNPDEYVVRCAADVVKRGVYHGLRRAVETCDAALMQFCIRRHVTNVLCPKRTLWPESGRDLLGHMGKTAKVNLLDIKVGQTTDEFQ